MEKEVPSPQDILRIAGEDRPVDRSEIGIEAAANDKAVQGGHVKVTFNHDGQDDKTHDK